MLWLTTVNPTFNKGTFKKMLRFGVGEGGGRRRCRKSWAYLWKNPGHAPACIVQGWRKTPFFCTQGLSNYSSDVFRVVVEDTPKFVRIRSDSLSSKAMNGRCDFWVEILCPDCFQYTSTTELNCEPWNAFPFVSCSLTFTERCQCVFHQRKSFAQ